MSNLPDSDQVTLLQTRNLELSPFVLDEIEGHDFRLRPRRAISLWPSLTEDEQFLCLEHAPWSLDVFATTRAELFSELKEQMLMLWREYAREEDKALSEPAQQVKRQLLADWEEATQVDRMPTVVTKKTIAVRRYFRKMASPDI